MTDIKTYAEESGHEHNQGQDIDPLAPLCEYGNWDDAAAELYRGKETQETRSERLIGALAYGRTRARRSVAFIFSLQQENRAVEGSEAFRLLQEQELV